MADDSSIRIQTLLAAAVRECLLQQQGRDYRISEDECLRAVCVVLARFVQDLLGKVDGWSRYAWVDDIEPCTANRDSPNGLLLTGLMIWANGPKSAFLIDPLYASIRLCGNSPTKLIYEIRFENADRGVGKRFFGSSQDYPQVPVENWLLTFVSGE